MMTKMARQVNEEVNREKTGGADEIKFGKQMTTGFHNLPFAMLTRRKWRDGDSFDVWSTLLVGKNGQVNKSSFFKATHDCDDVGINLMSIFRKHRIPNHSRHRDIAWHNTSQINNVLIAVTRESWAHTHVRKQHNIPIHCVIVLWIKRRF